MGKRIKYLFLIVFGLGVMSLFASSSQTIKLHKGWNLVSMQESNLSKLGNSIRLIWGFKNSQWYAYSIYENITSKINSAGIAKLNETNSSEGVWILSDKDMNTTVENQAFAKYTIHKGWNLLGTNKTMQASLFNGSSVSFLWKYDTTKQQWLLYRSDGINEYFGFQKFVNIQANSGFWVFGKSNSSVNYGDGNITTETNTSMTPLNSAEAFKFLNLATFGATKELRDEFKSKGVKKWLDAQLALPYKANMQLKRTIELAKKIAPSRYPDTEEAYLADNDTVFNKGPDYVGMQRIQMTAWFRSALFDKDQLRQRVAYALSQIIVESLAEPLFRKRTEALAKYFDILTKNAFGNYRDLLIDISHSSSMGVYLTYNGSKKYYSDGKTTIYPDENYARELMQLFTIGLYQLNIDGSLKLKNGQPIPTYTQKDVNEIARVFTGWDLKRNRKFGLANTKQGDFTQPLEFTAQYHDAGSKIILGTTISAENSGSKDIADLIDILMNNASMAPFISKQLIMRLTKSNPSPAYIARVAKVFNNDGHGIKGNLKAVIKAIYLDDEILDNLDKVQKYKEPLLAYTQMLRAFKVANLPKWTPSKTSGLEVSDAVLFNDPTPFLGQAPARAFSVFNFYDNGYIPNDTTFKSQKLVAPELQIQTDNIFINFHNEIAMILERDTRRLTKKYGMNLNNLDSVIHKGRAMFFYLQKSKYLLDLSDEYNVMEQALEGDVNGSIENLTYTTRINDASADAHGVTNRDRAIKALINELDDKLTGGTLDPTYKTFLFNAYKEEMYTNYNIANKQGTANTEVNIHRYIMTPIITAIISSDAYMVQ